MNSYDKNAWRHAKEEVEALLDYGTFADRCNGVLVRAAMASLMGKYPKMWEHCV